MDFTVMVLFRVDVDSWHAADAEMLTLLGWAEYNVCGSVHSIRVWRYNGRFLVPRASRQM